MTHAIGAEVYVSGYKRSGTHTTRCPDCAGHRRLKVTLGDETEVYIACVCCERGYDGSLGTLEVTEYEPDVKLVTIAGIEMRKDKETEYYVDAPGGGSHIWTESKTHLDSASALVHSRERIEEVLAEDYKSLQARARPEKTWAWNVRHYRSEIKRLESSLAFLRTKLSYAKEQE